MKYLGDSFLETEDIKGKVDLHTVRELATKYNIGALSFPEFQQLTFDTKEMTLRAIREIGVNRVLFSNNLKNYQKYRKVLETNGGFKFPDGPTLDAKTDNPMYS